MISSINFWPVIVSAVVAFAIGALWYSPILFGKDYMELTRTSDKDVDDGEKRGMWKLYIGQLIVTIVSFLVLGFLIVSMGSRTAGDGAFVGFLVWLGFSLTTGIGDLLWSKKPLKLLLISEIYSLVIMLIGGAIIGAWR